MSDRFTKTDDQYARRRRKLADPHHVLNPALPRVPPPMSGPSPGPPPPKVQRVVQGLELNPPQPGFGEGAFAQWPHPDEIFRIKVLYHSRTDPTIRMAERVTRRPGPTRAVSVVIDERTEIFPGPPPSTIRYISAIPQPDIKVLQVVIEFLGPVLAPV